MHQDRTSGLISLSATRRRTGRSGGLPIPGAAICDVIRGDLLTLRTTGGSFTPATQLCLANDLEGTSVLDPDIPGVGSGFWYLMRADQCSGGATYEEGSRWQVGLRDPEIQGSGLQCP